MTEQEIDEIRQWRQEYRKIVRRHRRRVPATTSPILGAAVAAAPPRPRAAPVLPSGVQLKKGRYVAQVYEGKATRYLGCFATVEEAAEVARRARERRDAAKGVA